MFRARMLAGAAIAGLVLAGPALPAAADGLSRFEQAIKDAPAGVLSYKSGKALGDSGFVLEEAVVNPDPDATGPDKPEPVHIKRISVEDFDFASAEKKATPNFVKMRAEGIVIGAKAIEGVNLKELAGLDTVTADFQLDYRVDPERKTMSLNRFEIDLHQLARIELSMVLDGVEAEAMETTAPSATLRTASLVFEDRSLLGKSVPAAAKAQGSNADDMVKMAKAVLDGLRDGQGAATLAVLDALASFVEDYKKPKGALRLTLTPTGKASVATIGELKDPEEAIKMLGLVVSYPGTRKQTPAKPGK